LRGPAQFQPRLCALILSLLLPLILSLILPRRLADIAATALRRRDSRGQLVSKRGQGVALAGSGLRLRTAREVIVLWIGPCGGPRSAIGLRL
jgi:hypothetical protein